MENRNSPYRWIVLGSFAFINLTIQTLWISYAPISIAAGSYYGVDDLRIGLFAMSFMIAFIPLSLPASWAIDRFGFRLSVGIPALAMGAAGILRGFAGPHYGRALAATVAIAAVQPFLLNAWTTVPAKWFPANQRASAVGLVTLGNLIGTALGMILPPMLLDTGMDPGTMQIWFGAAALLSAVLFALLAREKPRSPIDCGGEVPKALMLTGLRNALSSRHFLITLGISFIGLGVFNGITTWIEPIVRPRGLSPADAGNLGALMLAGGLAGAVIMPALSDKTGKRKPFLTISFFGTIPGIAGLAFFKQPAPIYLSACAIGFFLVSALPVAMQYAAEIARPTPEGTSNGLMQLTGQGAVVFVYAMEAAKSADGSFTNSLAAAAALLCAGLVAIRMLKEAEIPVPNP